MWETSRGIPPVSNNEAVWQFYPNLKRKRGVKGPQNGRHLLYYTVLQVVWVVNQNKEFCTFHQFKTRAVNRDNVTLYIDYNVMISDFPFSLYNWFLHLISPVLPSTRKRTFSFSSSGNFQGSFFFLFLSSSSFFPPTSKMEREREPTMRWIRASIW